MNSPLIIFENKLPIELLNHIQSYMVNDIAVKALCDYFDYLYNKKEIYEEFVYEQYVMPNCRCIEYFNNIAQRWKTRECDACFIYESTFTYMPEDFRLCIWDNTAQYQKIKYGEKKNEEYYEWLEQDADWESYLT